MAPVAERRAAKAPLPAPRPETDLAFSRSWGDPDVEVALVERLESSREGPLRAALVASGGCTALALLACARMERVDAVDLNPAQLHFVELRRRATDHLRQDEQLELLGYSEASGAEREALYQRLRFALPEATRAFWDARTEEVRYGLARVGRLETLLGELAERLLEHGLDPVQRPAEALGHPEWNRTFEQVFDRGRLALAFGAAAVAYSTERSFSAHFSARFADALRRSRAKRNPFLARLFSLPLVEEDLPLCLREAAQDEIRAGGLDRLRLHGGPFLGRLLALHDDSGQGYDLVDLSDLLDWMPVTERYAVVRKLASVLRPGGMVVARRFNGDGSLVQVLKSHLDVDTALSAELTEKERSPVYREVVVAFRRG